MDSTTEASGRVTRALRKRLISTDSDAGSSRPVTPVQSVLAAAGAANSPKKTTRMARRNSNSGVGGTPVKTPGKRAGNAVAVIADETNITPARRTTRRSSITRTENDSTPKHEMKTQNFQSIKEETFDDRITRSKSKTPEKPDPLSVAHSIAQLSTQVEEEFKNESSEYQELTLITPQKSISALKQTMTSEQTSINAEKNKESNIDSHVDDNLKVGDKLESSSKTLLTVTPSAKNDKKNTNDLLAEVTGISTSNVGDKKIESSQKQECQTTHQKSDSLENLLKLESVEETENENECTEYQELTLISPQKSISALKQTMTSEQTSINAEKNNESNIDSHDEDNLKVGDKLESSSKTLLTVTPSAENDKKNTNDLLVKVNEIPISNVGDKKIESSQKQECQTTPQKSDSLENLKLESEEETENENENSEYQELTLITPQKSKSTLKQTMTSEQTSINAEKNNESNIDSHDDDNLKVADKLESPSKTLIPVTLSAKNDKINTNDLLVKGNEILISNVGDKKVESSQKQECQTTLQKSESLEHLKLESEEETENEHEISEYQELTLITPQKSKSTLKQTMTSEQTSINAEKNNESNIDSHDDDNLKVGDKLESPSKTLLPVTLSAKNDKINTNDLLVKVNEIPISNVGDKKIESSQKQECQTTPQKSDSLENLKLESEEETENDHEISEYQELTQGLTLITKKISKTSLPTTNKSLENNPMETKISEQLNKSQVKEIASKSFSPLNQAIESSPLDGDVTKDMPFEVNETMPPEKELNETENTTLKRTSLIKNDKTNIPECNEEQEMNVNKSKLEKNFETKHYSLANSNEVHIENVTEIIAKKNEEKEISHESDQAYAVLKESKQYEKEFLKDSGANSTAINNNSILGKSQEEISYATPIRNAKKVHKLGSKGESLKKVGFSNHISDDECEKSIYPKTPVSVKIKSFNQNSSDDEISFSGASCESVIILNDTIGVEIPETQQEMIDKTIADNDTIISVDEGDYENEEKVISSSVKAIQEGNNVEEEFSPSSEKASKVHLNDKKHIEILSNEGGNLKWFNPSVVATSSKLDAISNDGILVKKTFEESAVEKKNSIAEKKITKTAERSDDDESHNDEYDDECLNEDEEEMYQQRKHPFHDDEAMVVDDNYESGDSMDSEERREMKENEIPFDGESIGSLTTEEEDNEEEEEEESDDSFIVPDICDIQEAGDDSSYSEFDEKVVKTDEKKKNTYKRIRKVSASSSSDEDELNGTNNSKENKLKIFTKMYGNDSKINNVRSGQEKDFDIKISKDVNENIEIVEDQTPRHNVNKSLNSSGLSDSARRLQSSDPNLNVSNEAEEDVEGSALDKSRKEFLGTLNQSDRFNKSCRDLNTEVDLSSDTLGTSNNKDAIDNSKNTNKTSDSEQEEKADKQVTSSTFHNEDEFVLIERKKNKARKSLESKRSESHLGEVSVSSEEENENNELSDEEKENAEMENNLNIDSNYQPGLSVSFGNFKKQKKEKKALQRSYTIGVSVHDGEIETQVLESQKIKSTDIVASSSSSPLGSLSSNEETNDNVLSSDDVRYLENIKHMPLGHPLVRTRRQSLALPTNPDMEIGDSATTHYSTRNKRKTLGVLSAVNEFKPSQSFVDSLELRKAELAKQTSKRKRLSKSFSGVAADNSVVDIDVRHLHKRSKLNLENSLADSLDNTKRDNSLCLKATVGHSSTPHDKDGNNKKLNNSGVRRILNRCDEILELANRAKLESKLNYRKSKIRVSKKNKKRMQQRRSSSLESKRDKLRAPVAKQIKKCDKTKLAVTQALKASANIIIGKQQKKELDVSCSKSKRLSPEDLKAIAATSNTQTNGRNIQIDEELKCRNYATAAGNVVEMLQSPPKKKKQKIIRLPTGNVCVEPLTPEKRSILTCNGIAFKETYLTPSAVGFKVREVPNSSNGQQKHYKRRRNEEGGTQPLRIPQWTQSGMFIEEELSPSSDPLTSISHGRITKRKHLGQLQNNFKQIALQRGDIKQITAREILQLRERHQACNQYY